MEMLSPKLVVPSPARSVDLVMRDGATIRLRQYGHTGHRQLALCHGNGLAINAYLPFWRPLIEDFELTVFDLRNHGESPSHAVHNYVMIPGTTHFLQIEKPTECKEALLSLVADAYQQPSSR